MNAASGERLRLGPAPGATPATQEHHGERHERDHGRERHQHTCPVCQGLLRPLVTQFGTRGVIGNAVMTMPSEIDGEVVEEVISRRSTHRRHSREEKEQYVADYDALPATGGQRGSYLRQKDPRRNQISTWRREVVERASGLSSRRVKRTPMEVENDKLRAANVKLEAELKRTRLALEITGKAHALLELLSESAAYENEQPK